MNKFLKFPVIAAMLIFAATTMISCKKNFDEPPGPQDPNFTANTSIKDFKAMHTVPGQLDVITSDIIISGIVVADDQSGNLYKQLFIQDSTGALQILLNANSLYATYPVGRKIFIKCKGLCLSDNNKTMELGIKATVAGLPSLEGIPVGLIQNYVVGGSINNPVVPIPVTYSQLSTNMQDKYIGALIQLDGYRFATPNATYSDTSAYKSTVNLDLKPCSGATIILRTSAYANFAGTQVAQGRGTIAAIYTVYGTTRQLILRDPSDINFDQPYDCPLPPGTLLSQDFESVTATNQPLAFPGWKNVGEVGGVSFLSAIFGPVKAGKISAFSTGAPTVSSWLITPAINLAGAPAPKLSFMNAAGYNVGATTFKVMVSTNYDGGNTPSSATWTTLTGVNLAVAPTTGYSSFVSSGILPIPAAFANQIIYIAFKYDGGDPTKTTTYEIDDIKVTAN